MAVRVLCRVLYLKSVSKLAPPKAVVVSKKTQRKTILTDGF